MKILEKYKELSLASKASFWFAICSVLQKGIAFIATPIYTRLLTTEEYGYFSVFNSWLSIFTVLATLNLSQAVMNNALAKKEAFNSTSRQILSNFQFLEIIIICVVSALGILVNFFFPTLLGLENKLIISIFVDVFFTSAVSLWTTTLKFEYKYKPVIFISLVVSTLTVVSNVLFIKFYDDKMYSIIYGTIVILVLMYMPIMFYNLIKGHSFLNLKLWKYALLFNIPLIPHYLSMIILGSSDRIMIESLISKSASALYSVPYSIANLASIVILAINSSLVPSTYSRLKEKNFDGFSKKITLILLMFLIIVFGIMLLGPEALYLMGGEAYMEAKWVIPPVAASMFFMFLYPLFGNIEFFYEKKFFTMICSIIAAIANIGLNYLFIPIYGYVAAAFTTLFCYGLMALAHYFVYKYICNKYELSNVYNCKLLLIFSAISLALVGFCYLLYLNNIVRYVIIGLIVFMALIFIKPIFKFIKSLIS